MALIFEKFFPYIVAALVGTGLGMWVRGVDADRVLAREKADHAADVKTYRDQIAAMNAAADSAFQKAVADHQAQEGKIASLDAQYTEEKNRHEADNARYARALAAGTERLRVQVSHCSVSGSGKAAGAASAARVDDGETSYADVAPAAAERVVRVATDDQHEIDKLTALQAYVCTIKPDLPACVAGQ